MHVDTITLLNFRNYLNLSLNFSDNINIFVGDNAQGKTNLLEAIYLGAMARSHRIFPEQELINWHKEEAVISITFFRKQVKNFLKIKLIQNKNKEIIYNNYTCSLKEIIGSLTAVLFSPEDLLIVKGAPALRRRFLDNEISQASPSYYRNLMDYNRILIQRNNLLKNIKEKKESREILDTWNEQLVKKAALITFKRIEAIKKLKMIANLYHRKLTSSKESLSINYFIQGLNGEFKDTSNMQDWYYEKIKENEKEDILRGSTSIGPHRDDLIFLINDYNLKNFGSQGQQRTGILALKLAELEFIKSETGEYPVLLLDDIMSELDEKRRNELLFFLKERVQTFITTTDMGYFPKSLSARFYKIQEGKVIE